MLHTTRGIVLRAIRYNDKAVIANIYTEQFGLQGYLAHSGKSKKNALLQPLTCLSLTVNHRYNANLQHIKEAVCSPVFTDIPYNTVKSSIAIFIAEVIFRAVKEEESNLTLFSFLHDNIVFLDEEKNNCANFHLVFMAQLSRHLGFFPCDNFSEENIFFDLEEGLFTNQAPAHPNYIGSNWAHCFARLINTPVSEHWRIDINKAQRKELLAALMDYYRLHLQGMSEVRSHRVLEEVML